MPLDSIPVSEPVGGDADLAAASEIGRPRADRRRAVLGVVFVGLVFLAAAFAIYHQRHELGDSIRKIGVWPIIASFALGVFGIGLTFPSWHAVLRGLDVDIPRGAAATVFFTSQLGKYLPGSVWPVVLQMEAGSSRGASRRTMVSANLITLVIGCSVGLVAATLLLPFADATALHRYWWLLLLLPLLLALLHPRAIPWLLDKAFGLLRREPLGERLDLRSSLESAGWSLGSFVALGMHIAVLALAFGAPTGTTILLSIGGMSLAVAGGVLFIPAPAGAGIREVILALVLGAQLTNSQALAVVIASRVILIVGDLSLAVVAFAARRGQRIV